MFKKNKIDELESKIIETCNISCCPIISGIVDVSSSTPRIQIDAEEFLSLIKLIKPKAVYIAKLIFDAMEDTAAQISNDEINLENIPNITSFLKKWSLKDGEANQLLVGFMYNAIFHTVLAEIEWVSEFEIEVSNIVNNFKDEVYQKDEAAEKEKKIFFSKYIEVLISDPRYSGPKVGIAKRKVLAENLFPDLEEEGLKYIVEQAENIFWLKTATSASK